ncbi:MAG: glycosyltransferase family 4 protein [Pseudomonadota bacterium]
MRILVLTPTFLPAIGGAELLILQVFRRLARRHTVLVLTPHLSQKLLKSSSSKEYNRLINFQVSRYHDRLTMIRVRGHRLTCGLIPPFSLSAVSAVRRAVQEFKPNVMNVHYVMPTGLAGLYAQKFLRIPCVITCIGRDVPGPGVPPLWKYWHRLIGLGCSDMTFVSGYCREVIYGASCLHGHIIYGGVEAPVPVSHEQLASFRARFEIPGNAPVLFALQRVDVLKRIDVIIRSMPAILDREPEARLIIGGKGDDLERLKGLAVELGIAGRVIFPGFIPDGEIPVYQMAADLFLFHSTYETFGIVLAEAMSYAKAVVSVANTAIREVVDNGSTGLLVPTLDHRAFAQAVLELIRDRPRREEMGRRGSEKVGRLFRWDAIAGQYESVLESAAFEADLA